MIDFGFLNIAEEKVYIKDIPAIILTPKDKNDDMATIILYHGWSSCKENQRIRGFILASAGYRVVIADAINHGERNAFSEYGLDKGDEMWTTVFNSIDEWDLLVDGLIDKYGIDKDKIGLIGNSMGGITAGGIYTENKNIRVLVVLNGSMAWENTNNIIKDTINITMTEKLKGIEKRIKRIDPIKNIDLLVDRPIMLLHGDSDEIVSVDSERLFFNEINSRYKDKRKIKFIEYEGLNHLVTTNMMEESIVFFNQYLKS